MCRFTCWYITSYCVYGFKFLRTMHTIIVWMRLLTDFKALPTGFSFYFLLFCFLHLTHLRSGSLPLQSFVICVVDPVMILRNICFPLSFSPVQRKRRCLRTKLLVIFERNNVWSLLPLVTGADLKGALFKLT